MKAPDSERMKVIVAANVGNRDVMLNGEPIDPARSGGLNVLRDLETLRERLTLPIIRPCLEEILKDEDAIDILLLCYTDQDEQSCDSGFREADTVHITEVAKELLKAGKDLDIRKVVTVHIDSDPHLYDECYRFYREKFASRTDSFPPSATRCYVLPAGGTPACSTGLLLASIAEYGANARQIYKSPDKPPRGLGFGNMVLRDYLSERARALLDTYRFVEVAEIFGEECFGNDLAAQDMAKSSAARLQFDFEAALRGIRIAERDANSCGKEHLSELSKGLHQLMSDDESENQRAKLQELFWQIIIKLQGEEWGDFLSRWYCFSEEIVKLACKRAGLGEVVRERFNDSEFTNKHPKLAECVQQKNRDKSWNTLSGSNIQEISLEREGIVRNIALLECCAETGGSQEVHDLLASWKRLSGLQTLRNRTFIAHGFDSVSPDKLSDATGIAEEELTPNIDRAARSMLKAVGCDVVERNPFDHYRAFLLARLK